MSITAKLALVFVLFAAILLTGVSTLAYTNGHLALQLATTTNLQSQAIEKEAAFTSWVEHRQTDIAALANSPQLRSYLTTLRTDSDPAIARTMHNQLVAELQPKTENDSTYLELFVIEPQQGMVIASTDPTKEGTFKESQPYFIEGKRRPYIQNPYYSNASRDLAMTGSAPFWSSDGHLLGVLAGHLNLDEVRAIINRRSTVYQTDDAFLINTSALFVTQPSLVTDPVVLQRGNHSEASRLCLAGQSGAILADDYRGIPSIIVYRWLTERKLCLIVEMDQSEAFAPAREFGITLILIGSLALLAASVVAVGLARTITQPVLALQAGVARFGHTDMNLRLPENRNDELGALAHEFNSMAARLAEKEIQLHTYADQLEREVEARTNQLRQSEEKHRSLIEQAGDGIFVSDASGTYISINPSGCAMLGYSLEELCGKKITDLLPANDQKREPPRFDELRAGKTIISERRMIRKDGSLLNVEISGKMLSNGQLQGIVRDITDRKRAQAELERTMSELTRSNIELQQFAYVASHDLQEPLRMVASYTQLLARRYQGKLDADADEFIGYAVDGATRMQKLINDLLSYSRVGTQAKPFAPVDCQSVVEHVLGNLALAIEECGATVTYAEMPVVQGDETQLAQLFQNLIANALKFRSTDPPRINICGERHHGEWLFAVRDNGIGIDPAYYERVFVIFQRLHTRDEYPGTGIGLAICKKIVNRHGGRIWIESAPGAGSTFFFTISDTQSSPYGSGMV